jgi:hypothetical protein
MSGILNVVLTSFGGAGAAVGLLSLYTNPNGEAVFSGKIRSRNDVMFTTFGTSASGTDLTVSASVPLDLVGLPWQNQLNNGTDSFAAANGVIDSGSNYIVVGNMNTPGTPTNPFRVWLIKFNSSGTVQWQKTVNAGSTGSYLTGVAVDNSDNIYCVGKSTFFNANGDMYSTKFNSSGVVQYQQYIGDTGSTVFENGVSVAVINQGTAPADLFLISGHTGSTGFAAVDSVMYFASMTTGARRSALQWRDTAGVTRQTGGPCIRGESDTICYIVTQSYSGASSSTNDNTVIVKAQINASTYGISILGFAALTMGGTTTSTICVDMVMNPANTHFYVLCNLSDGTFVVAKYTTAMSLQWERKVASTGVTLSAGGIAVDSFDNFYVSFQTAGTPTSSSILKMPGSGAGIGSTASIGGRTYTYTASTLNTYIDLLSSTYFRDSVSQTTTPGTPTPTNTASALTPSRTTVG